MLRGIFKCKRFALGWGFFFWKMRARKQIRGIYVKAWPVLQITVIDYNGNRNFDLQNISPTKSRGFIRVHALRLKIWATQTLSWSSISWHIEDMHKRFSMCNTNPENVLNFIWHPGHVNGRVVLSSKFKGSSDSSTSFLFELLLLRVKLVAVELDPSKSDTEELALLGFHILDLTKKRR